jgi:plastocyanin
MRTRWAAAVVLAVAAACARTPTEHRVEIRGLRFEPPEIRIARGDTIRWINHDIVPHTATAADSSWDSAGVPSGGEYALVPTRRGTLRYACAYHPDMTGRIVVR